MRFDGITYDDYWFDAPNKLYTVYMCEECRKKYNIATQGLAEQFGGGVPEGAICSVKGCENEADYDFAIPLGEVVAECCPHCDHENVLVNWNVKADGYEVVCEECGEKIMLCTECYYHDNNGDHCDWTEESGCFRKRSVK